MLPPSLKVRKFLKMKVKSSTLRVQKFNFTGNICFFGHKIEEVSFWPFKSVFFASSH